MKKTKTIAFIIPNFGRNYDYRCWLVLKKLVIRILTSSIEKETRKKS